MGSEGSVKKECFQSSLKNSYSLWCSQVVRESVPQTRSGRVECSVTLGAELSPGLVEQVGAGRAEGSCSGLGGEQFLEVRRGISVDALVG